jgi:hypothetical protein
MEPIPPDTSDHDAVPAPKPDRLALSLSGGGYRATLFAAGALLAVADSEMRTRVTSVSSVSGGSIASAATLGGFNDPTPDDPDPMARRVAELARLTQTNAVSTEFALRVTKYALLALGFPLAFLLVAPIGTELLQAKHDPNPPSVFEDLLEFMRNSEGAIGALNWMATVFPFVLLVVIPVVAVVTATSAIVGSAYSVQGVVETLAGRALNRRDRGIGTDLRELASYEGDLERILCATDLSTGSHIYLTSTTVLAPGVDGLAPNVYLADAVAASACFPGFRPLVFRPRELGFTVPDQNAKPRIHGSFGRLAIGSLGFAGATVAIAALVARMTGAAFPGNIGFLVAIGGALLGSLITLLCARLLRSKDDVVLVDGGVCDNLGAAFALLAKDDRYDRLPHISGTEKAALMLVIDASKPFVPDEKGNGLDELVPLRVRGAQRSVLRLLGSANAAARKHVIQLALAAQGDVQGAIVSIEEPPPLPVRQDGSGQDDREFDLPGVASITANTPTTLSALEPSVVAYLILHGYRLTQAKLVEQGVQLARSRSTRELIEAVLIGPNATPKEAAYWTKWPEPDETPLRRPRISRFDGNGPYSKRARRLRLISLGVLIVVYSAAVVAALGGPGLLPLEH